VVDHHNTPAVGKSQPRVRGVGQWRSISPAVEATGIARLRTSNPARAVAVPISTPRATASIDAADQTIFQQFINLNLDGYQNYDKAVDIFYLTIAFLSVYRNWTNTTAINVARFPWHYRLFGVWLFEVVQQRWILFVFPNTFEYFFIAYVAIATQWDPTPHQRAVIAMATFIWIVIKLPQAWWIHVTQNDFTDFTDFIKVTVFGVDGTDS